MVFIVIIRIISGPLSLDINAHSVIVILHAYVLQSCFQLLIKQGRKQTFPNYGFFQILICERIWKLGSAPPPCSQTLNSAWSPCITISVSALLWETDGPGKKSLMESLQTLYYTIPDFSAMNGSYRLNLLSGNSSSSHYN